MRKILFILAVFAFTAAVPVYAADNVSGTWVLTQMNPMGEADSFDMVITQDGKKLNVTVTRSEAKFMMSGEGTLKGNKIKFNLKDPDHNQFEFIFEGKVTGKKMEGTRKLQSTSGSKFRVDSPPSSGGGNSPTEPPIDSGGSASGDEASGGEISDPWSAVMK